MQLCTVLLCCVVAVVEVAVVVVGVVRVLLSRGTVRRSSAPRACAWNATTAPRSDTYQRRTRAPRYHACSRVAASCRDDNHCLENNFTRYCLIFLFLLLLKTH